MKPLCSGYIASLAAPEDPSGVADRPEGIRLVPPGVNSRHALAEALLGIKATTVEEYRSRAHALAMNWKGEV